MPDFDFDDFLEEVGRKLTDIASETAGEVRDAAIADGKAFLEASRESLKRWTKKLAVGELSAENSRISWRVRRTWPRWLPSNKR